MNLNEFLDSLIMPFESNIREGLGKIETLKIMHFKTAHIHFLRIARLRFRINSDYGYWPEYLWTEGSTRREAAAGRSLATV